MLRIAVQAQEDQIRFRQIKGKRAVCDDVYNQEPHAFCLDDQIPQRAFSILPKEGLSAAKE